MTILSAQEVATMLKKDYKTILVLAKEGLLPHTKIGQQYLFTEEGLKKFFADCEAKSIEKRDNDYPLLRIAK